MRKVKDVKGILASIGLGLVLATCTGTASTTPTPAPTPTQIGRLTLTDTACTFEPATAVIRPGPISLAVFNQTQGVVLVMFGQIAEGTTYEEVDAAFRNAVGLAEAGVMLPGRANHWLGFAPLSLGPGGSTALTQTTVAATHAIVCFHRYANNGQTAPYGLVGPIEIR